MLDHYKPLIPQVPETTVPWQPPLRSGTVGAPLMSNRSAEGFAVLGILFLSISAYFQCCAPCSWHRAASLKDVPARCIDGFKE